MKRYRTVLGLSLLFLLFGERSAPALGQSGLVTEGMITPKDATTAADIVVVQVRTAEQVPGPPVVVALDPPRLVLSYQAGPTGTSLAEPFPQHAGRLAAGTWRVYSYGLDWTGHSGEPRFEGFSGPASFHVTRGQVYPQRAHPLAGEPFSLTVDGPWNSSCVPQIERVSIESGRVVIHARRTEPTCLPANDTPTPFKVDVPVAPLTAGRYEVEVRVPRLENAQDFEVYATASFRVVPAGEPRILDLGLEPDPAREAQLLVVEAEIPSSPAGGGCSSWQLRPRNAWAHGRDLYARFEVEPVQGEPVAGACGDAITATYRFPLPDLETGLYRILVQREQGTDSGAFEFWAQSPTLVESQQLAQLIHGRFRVTVTWRDHAGRTGRGFPVVYEEGSSAVFAFFSDDNWELLVKVLDGCSITDHYWVFASASTDVEYTLNVEDVVSGAEAVYRNELGRASPAFTDTTALAGCE